MVADTSCHVFQREDSFSYVKKTRKTGEKDCTFATSFQELQLPVSVTDAWAVMPTQLC